MHDKSSVLLLPSIFKCVMSVVFLCHSFQCNGGLASSGGRGTGGGDPRAAKASCSAVYISGETPQPTQPTSMPLLRYDLLDQGLQRQVEACFESYAQF